MTTENEMADRSPILPAHIEETVRSIAELHAEQHQQTTPLQRVVNRATAWVGRPAFAGFLTLIVLAWVLGNLGVLWLGGQPWDPPPFNWLATLVSLAALYTTVLILATQRHDDQLASHREQLTLELAILSEQKSAKIIRLLEEIRLDSPDLVNRVDPEAQAMSMPADPQSVLEAIRDTHEDLADPSRPDLATAGTDATRPERGARLTQTRDGSPASTMPGDSHPCSVSGCRTDHVSPGLHPP